MLLNYGMMMLSVLSLLPFAYGFQSAQAAGCSLCPDGGAMTHPNRLLPSSYDTCIEKEMNLIDIPEDVCELVRTHYLDEDDVVDVTSFCGCNVSLPPNICPFCDGLVDFPSETSLRTTNNRIDKTCDDFAELAPFVVDPNYCDYIQSFAQFCCEPDATCTLCSDGSIAQFPDRPLGFGGSNPPTCDSFAVGLSQLESPEACSDFRRIFGPVNFESWCGCPNEPIPDICTLCGDGQTLTNTNVQIPDMSGMTCADAAELARSYVVDDSDSCYGYISTFSAECCGPETKNNGSRFPNVYVFSAGNVHEISAFTSRLIVIAAVLSGFAIL